MIASGIATPDAIPDVRNAVAAPRDLGPDDCENLQD